MRHWSAADIARVTGGQARGEWWAHGVSIDSRTINPGELFVALTDIRDGHDFAGHALERGAAGALVQHVPAGLGTEAPLVIVEDTGRALAALGGHARANGNARIVAVTGSAGKTTTKEMLRLMLGAQGKCHAAEASHNNHWGVPLTLARMPPSARFAVVEVGMNQPGEIAALAAMVCPDVALITSIGPAHLGAFTSVEDIAREKASIALGVRRGGSVILPSGGRHARTLAETASSRRQSWFGEGTGTWRLAGMRAHGDGMALLCEGPCGPHVLELASSARHFALDALGALAAVEAIGADPGVAARALRAWRPLAGRGCQRKVAVGGNNAIGGQATLIDDCYNANPCSVAAALATLAAHPVSGSGRRLAVLGDMAELGKHSVPMHRGLARLEPLQNIDLVFCVGPCMRELHRKLPPGQRGAWCSDAAAAARVVSRHLRDGDVMLIKGSRSMKLEHVVQRIEKSDP